MTASPDPAKVHLAETAIGEAFDRLNARMNDPDQANPLISLGEVLEWTFGLEQHLKATPGYFTNRKADADGQMLAGLMYARGKLAHSLAEVVDVVTLPPTIMQGGTGGRRGGWARISRGTVRDYRWKPDLGPLRGRATDREREQHAFYRDVVAGQQLVPPIDKARSYLGKVRAASV
jgi:hypothetical protein